MTSEAVEAKFQVPEWRLASILNAVRTSESIFETRAPMYPELKAALSELLALRAEIQHANEALAACQAQAVGRIRELEARLRAARFDDDINDGDMDDDGDQLDSSPYCDCGSIAGEEEEAFNRCSACGKRLDP